MIKEILGIKKGMTRIYDEQGNITPVTLIQAGPCPVVSIKTKENDGYNAVQIGFGECKEKNANKPLAGIFKKSNIKPHRWLRECRVEKVDGMQIGQEIKLDIFAKGDILDVSGFTKGKGFAGVIKRYNFGGGPDTHGASDYQRHRGASAGQRPQVLKGTRMAGHMGDAAKTVQRLKVINILTEQNILLLKGSVPGSNNELLVIRQTTRKVKPKMVVESDKTKPPKGKGKAPKEAPKKKK